MDVTSELSIIKRNNRSQCPFIQTMQISLNNTLNRNSPLASNQYRYFHLTPAGGHSYSIEQWDNFVSTSLELFEISLVSAISHFQSRKIHLRSTAHSLYVYTCLPERFSIDRAPHRRVWIQPASLLCSDVQQLSRFLFLIVRSFSSAHWG